MSPPEWDGTCGEEAKADLPGRRAWARILACCAVFGCLFVLSGVVFAAVYVAVWAFSRR